MAGDNIEKFLGKFICQKDGFMSNEALCQIYKGDIVEIYYEEEPNALNEKFPLYSIWKKGAWVISTVQINKIEKFFRSYEKIRQDKIDSIL